MKPANYPRATLILAFFSFILWPLIIGWLALRPNSGNKVIPRSRLLNEISNVKMLRVGVVLNPPQAQRDVKTGEVSGYQVELIREIARQTNAKIEFEDTTFANMAAALESWVHVVVGGGFVSVERAANFAFTDPIFELGLGYVCRKDDTRFHNEADLKRPKLRVAFASGSASQEYVFANLPEAELIPLARGELARVALEVSSGRADVGIVNQAQCIMFEQKQPGLRYPTKGKPFHLFASSLAMRQGDPDGLTFLNTSIRTLRSNGFLAKLEQKFNANGEYWIPLPH